jgi:hypothetical protein
VVTVGLGVQNQHYVSLLALQAGPPQAAIGSYDPLARLGRVEPSAGDPGPRLSSLLVSIPILTNRMAEGHAGRAAGCWLPVGVAGERR